MAHAVRRLDVELQALRNQRARLVRWATARSEQTQLVERTRRLAESARRTLLNPTEELKKHVIALLDVKVQITSHPTCPTCQGRALIPRTATGPNNRRNTGDVCPTCLRFKTIPTIEIRGFLPTIDHLHDPPTTDSTATPFTLRSVG